jgi:PTH1 family peptidyl-tRNA hydrolase
MSDPIQLIVGLGNPGAKYTDTRHNAGFWFVDLLAREAGQSFRLESKFHGYTCQLPPPCRLLKPETFMNRSGQAVSALASFYRIPVTQILVVHDEIDLPPGTAKLKKGGGAGGHNGLKDIAQRLGSKDFWRLRLGVGHPGHRDDVINFVLNKPRQEEQTDIDDAMARSLNVMPMVLSGELEKAMNSLHSQR